MSKKTILQGLCAMAAVAVFALILYFILGTPTVDTSQVTAGIAYGINGETGNVSSAEMSGTDVDKVASIFNGKERTPAV